MGTLTLTKTWINLLSTGQAVSAYRADDDAEAYEVQGDVVTYAGGRQRSVSSEGVAGTFTFQLRLVPDADVTTLQSWIGQAVQVRDNRGRVLFGTYFAVGKKPWKDQLGTYDVAITLRTVTVVEGV